MNESLPEEENFLRDVGSEYDQFFDPDSYLNIP
jgi:hypothetical protein